MPSIFRFSGRANRTTFWVTSLLSLGINFLGVLLIIGAAAIGLMTNSFVLVTAFPVAVLVMLGSLVALFSVGYRRAQDLGHPGWWVAAYAIPGLQLAAFIYLGLRPTVNESGAEAQAPSRDVQA